MEILWIILFGLIAGALGKLLMPGDDPGGIIATILIGIAGSFLGFYLFRAIGIGDENKFDLGGLLGAVIGVMILLGIYRAVVGRRVRAHRRHRQGLALRRGGLRTAAPVFDRDGRPKGRPFLVSRSATTT